jgi:hypothetical protein
MVLLVSLLFTLLSLLGIVWIAVNGEPLTVDGLFMGLIFAMIALTSGGMALYELRRGKSGEKQEARARSGAGGDSVHRGLVQSVQFFEAHVGEPNKSIVTLLDGSRSPVMLVLEGDIRNALPVGQKVKVTLRKQKGYSVLVDVSYA